MWDHERKRKPDTAEFSIETPSPDKHELDLYIGEAARQTLNEQGRLEPADPDAMIGGTYTQS
jgi:hypothetical protein